jgi:hypothetical protein
MKLDEVPILEAIMGEKQAPIASETAAALVEGWIGKFMPADLTYKVVAVECGFHIWLDPHTLIIGVQDAIFESPELGIVGGEWKSHKAPKLKLNGEPYKGSTEEDWLNEITTGPQLAIYALAEHAGIYYEVGNPRPIRFNVQRPRIMVRAGLKTNPPKYWPTKQSSIYTFESDYLDSVESALASKANQIRAARRNPDLIPWQLVGKQCFDWGRECQFLKQYCESHAHPCGKESEVFNPHDPAFELALKHVDPERLADPNLVVLSASSYQLVCACAEKYRIITGYEGEKDQSVDLAIGICMHAGLAAYYRQLKKA